ncbi:glycosyltransferase [Bosea sp. 2YAB26]|uniref:glycosyltransferase n=1 Tax=Bosea sp. 2YAB26 TaxID=3237478 RepID=UPI003F9223F0
MGFGVSPRLKLRADGAIPFPRPGKRPLPEAFAEARSLPGHLSDLELEQLYAAAAGARSAHWFGADAEAIQAATMLYAGGAGRVEVVKPSSKHPPDLVVVQNGAAVPDDCLLLPQARVLRLEGFSKKASRRRQLHDKIRGGGRLRVVLINDVGFQYGAGVATRRQAQSFLMAGWDVAMVSWNAGTAGEYPPVAKLQAPGRWIHTCSLPDVHPNFRLTPEEIIERVVSAVKDAKPDFVLLGNIHGASWPIELLTALRDADFAVAAYMHDLHWVTGRCAYPGPCRKYVEDGCDETCPTAEQYPPLPRDRIRGEWLKRADVFSGPDAIPLIANSHWTAGIARSRFGNTAVIDTIHLALDHRQFARVDRTLARRLLGIADERPLVLLGSVNVKEERKGGPIFVSLLEQLRQRSDVGVLAFGHGSESLPCTKAFGMVTDERQMALIYSAADIFVGTALEEAFGQTLLEGAAVGLPIVAFNAGGVVEAVKNGETGILVEEKSAEAIIAAIDTLLADPALAASMGREGASRVEREFSLPVQAEAWRTYIQRIFLEPSV